MLRFRRTEPFLKSCQSACKEIPSPFFNPKCLLLCSATYQFYEWVHFINLRSQIVFTCCGAHVAGTTLRRHVTAHRRADDIAAAQRPMTALRCAVKTLSLSSSSLRRESEIKTWHTTLAWEGGGGLAVFRLPMPQGLFGVRPSAHWRFFAAAVKQPQRLLQ